MATKKTTGASASKTKSTATKATAKKAPAKKAPAKKAPAAKKSPAKKSPAKKAPAKKASAKKAPAKKAPAKKAPAAKKAAATAAAPAAPARKAKKKEELPFTLGDKVVYPHHGAATIVKLERRQFDGRRVEFYVLEIATDQLTVKVPAARAIELGVRPVISKTAARRVFQTLKDEPQEAGANWSRWYKLLNEKINSGDIYQVAEVVRDLVFAQQTKGISPALKRMLSKAKLILTSELRFALSLDEEDAMKRLERALPKVEEPVEA